MKEKPSKETLEKWHRSNNWKLGIFYYNKEDKLLPPKRIAWAGWTVNFIILFQLPFCDCNYHNNWNNITPPWIHIVKLLNSNIAQLL
jgi:hypothetical protein